MQVNDLQSIRWPSSNPDEILESFKILFRVWVERERKRKMFEKQKMFELNIVADINFEFINKMKIMAESYTCQHCECNYYILI